MTLGSLDYLYTPSGDVAGDLRYLVDVLGGEEGFAIEDGGIRVAMVRFGDAPAILLTDHLEGDRPIHLFAVEDLATARGELEGRGWTSERSVELPPGPAITFRTPGGLRMAIYEPVRPFVVESFKGRRDFGSRGTRLDPAGGPEMAAIAEPTTFRGFSPDAIQFLADLAENNDRAWFQPRKAEYERLLKEPMEAMIAALSDRLAARGVPILADPRKAPFRIYRDTRFSKDKSPYKTHLGASFPWVGGTDAHVPADGSHEERTHGNGGYFHFQPGEMFAGGGMWQMEKGTIDGFRTVLRDDPERVRGALEDPAFARWWGEVRPHDSLKRFPPGWPQDHPMAAMFLWKDIVFGRPLSDDEALSPNLPDLLAEGYAAATPIFRFLASLP